MVGYLFQNYDTIYVRFFSHVYLQSFLLHNIRALFCHVYLRSFLLCGVIIPKYITISLQTRIYAHKKAHIYIYALQTSLCIWGLVGVPESRRIRGTEIYRKQKPLHVRRS